MTAITLLIAPYDCGQRGARMGRGPLALLERGLDRALVAAGHPVQVVYVEASTPFRAEIATAFDLARQVSGQVARAVAAGSFPIVLSGNCGNALGCVSGISREAPGVIWFDAHGDFNTPETTKTGLLDGMVLATMTGRCWPRLAHSIPGFAPMADDHIVHVGWRWWDLYGDEEQQRLESSAMTIVPAERIRGAGMTAALTPALDKLGAQTTAAYVHLDVDVFDPKRVAPANGYAVEGGLGVDDVETALRLVQDRFAIRALTVACYDPDYDDAGQIDAAVVRLIGTVLARR